MHTLPEELPRGDPALGPQGPHFLLQEGGDVLLGSCGGFFGGRIQVEHHFGSDGRHQVHAAWTKKNSSFHICDKKLAII